MIAGSLSSWAGVPQFGNYCVSDFYRGEAKLPQFGDLSQYDSAELRCFGANPSDYSGRAPTSLVTSLFRAVLATAAAAFFLCGYAPRVAYRGEQYRSDSTLLIIEGCLGESCDCARLSGKEMSGPSEPGLYQYSQDHM
jgi:hypothetical protein